MIPHPGAILCYHSFTSRSLPSNSSVGISVDQFLSEMAMLNAISTVVPLSELLARHVAGRSTRGLTAVTFDDAYASLHSLAGPHLARLGVPFTVFVCSAPSASGAPFWWDRLEDLIPGLDLNARQNLCRSANMHPSSIDSTSEQGDLFGALRAWILAQCGGRCPAALEDCVSDLEARLGVHTMQRAMTFDELEQLSRTTRLDIGVHTISHPSLPSLPMQDKISEIGGCYSALRSRFESVLPILAVPYGLIDAETITASASAGMTATLALGNATLQRHAPGVPRICMTRDVPRWRFGMRLLGIAERLRGLRAPQTSSEALPPT